MFKLLYKFVTLHNLLNCFFYLFCFTCEFIVYLISSSAFFCACPLGSFQEGSRIDLHAVKKKTHSHIHTCIHPLTHRLSRIGKNSWSSFLSPLLHISRVSAPCSLHIFNVVHLRVFLVLYNLPNILVFPFPYFSSIKWMSVALISINFVFKL